MASVLCFNLNQKEQDGLEILRPNTTSVEKSQTAKQNGKFEGFQY